MLLVHQEVPDGGDGASEGGAIVRGNRPPPMLKIETCTGITGIGGDEWNVCTKVKSAHVVEMDAEEPP